jgi:hypothetical protein
VPERRPRVLMANNYSLVDAERRWRAGDYPAHHQWGAVALREAGYDVRFLPFASGRLGRRVARVVGSARGDPVTQARAVVTPGDVLLAAAPLTLAGLLRLRWPRRSVGVIHPAAAKERSLRAVMLGYDAVVCLSPVIRDDLVALGRDPATTLVAAWGPDLDFVGYQRRTTDGGGVFSSGKTLRDHDVVRDAATRCGAQFVLHDSGRGAPYAQILDEMANAGIVAISLRPGVAGMYGITELDDALALGKPVVMSRNPYIDLDVEAEGCGLVVEPGDRAAWAGAIGTLLADPERRAAMGRRGRAVAEARWNHRAYGDAVVRAVELATR